MTASGQDFLLCRDLKMSNPEPQPPGSYQEEKMILKLTTKKLNLPGCLRHKLWPPETGRQFLSENLILEALLSLVLGC
jgi:hypothetical protein